MLTVMVLQRGSHVSATPFSRSVHARITEALDWLVARKDLSWQSADERSATPNDLHGCDALILNKHLSPESLALARAARQLGMKVIYDLDDWMLGFPDYSGAGVDESRKAIFLNHLETATHVTVANRRLLDLMTPLCRNPILVPNGFNIDKYAPVSPAPASSKRIVFSNADEVKLRRFKDSFFGVLSRFFERHPEMELDFFGDPFREMNRLPFLKYQGSLGYSEHKYRLATGEYAFAIIPLSGPEDPEDLAFNGCKNPFKYLEYGGLAIPGIFSHSPIFDDVVKPGVTGCLIENTEQAWNDALERMTVDYEFRHKLAVNAHRDVNESHHISIEAEQLLGILTSE